MNTDHMNREERWSAARRVATGHVLAAVSGSRWADELVLRGSVLLRTWYGSLAREPGDLDFIVLPVYRRLGDDQARAMLDGIVRDAEEASRRDQDSGVLLTAKDTVQEETWEYTSAPGVRLLVPWKTMKHGWAKGEDPLSGNVQIDLAFAEPMPVEPEVALVSGPGGEPLAVQAATPGLSLAWKVYWLLSDEDKRPKDLYDAWLLAQHTPLDPDLLHAVHLASEFGPCFLRMTDLRRVKLDEDEFRAEVPGVPGTAADYVRLLADTLRFA
ncbi:nucleotidyl transferase AbiEii/AbiGii toxin family protein [Actinomadura roseirufa]|uniref:nucleotidyl transferase AbiEii/AbiGii toxin family protein n=1 Tax=Actinomadura roseirufa TaxID=2094049 RepID=UPI00104103A8|nr:nucleotidyl transferase AbiEii/AbiGii toxin family protein [Actinomadura roseirufa]